MARGCVTNEYLGKKQCKALEASYRADGQPNVVIKCSFCNTDGCNGGPVGNLGKLINNIFDLYVRNKICRMSCSKMNLIFFCAESGIKIHSEDKFYIGKSKIF